MANTGTKIYPSILIRKAVIFPTEKIPLVFEGEEAVETIKNAIDADRQVVVVFKKNGDRSPMGVLGKIIQSWSLTPVSMGVVIEGLEKVRIARIFADNKVSKAEVEMIFSAEVETTELEAIIRSVYSQFKTVVELEGTMPLFLIEEMQREHVSPSSLSYVIAASLGMGFKEKLEFLEILDTKKRLEVLNIKLAREINILKTEKRIQRNVQKEMGKTQKEYILRERMRAIEKELGISEEHREYDELEKKLKKSKMPKDTESKALKELSRLRSMPSVSAEAPYIRTYLDWLAGLPWSVKSKTVLSIKKAKVVLDEDHYGLDKVKERILEYLAVQKLTKGKSKATIMCFVGPPGTGKTSVGKSIARALGRKFYRMSLGGIRDEAEMRGHRRTYVGALPGRIIQGMHAVGVKNPVFMLDEIDKVGADFRGDPAAALLEILDPEQNNSFTDHYLEVPYDLSEVIFIATANMLYSIPPALLDRMEVIEFSGYTDEDKFHIADNFVLPRVFSSHGLKKNLLEISDGAIRKIISKYTREAGIRNLERKLSEVVRKVAKKIAENSRRKKIMVGEENVFEYLGPEEYSITMKEEKDEVGISTGLAWTPAGGEIIFIESALIPGRGNLILTGQLGKTMQESAKAAISYIRLKSKELKFDSNFFTKNDIHIHVPSGAIPKDGPSAGIAIAVSLTSSLTGRKVKKEVAMTGEVTLSGKILEIGGVKEKVLAAHRAGVEIVILPKNNEKNLIDVPEEVKKNLKFKFVSHVDDVMNLALKK